MADRMRVTSFIGDTERLEDPSGTSSPDLLGWVAGSLTFPHVERVNRQAFPATRETSDEYTSRRATNPQLLRHPARPRSVGRTALRRRRASCEEALTDRGVEGQMAVRLQAVTRLGWMAWRRLPQIRSAAFHRGGGLAYCLVRGPPIHGGGAGCEGGGPGEQPDGVLVVAPGHGDELVEGLGFLLPGSSLVALTRHRQEFSFRLLAELGVPRVPPEFG